MKSNQYHKCNINFISEYCLINNEKIHVLKYIENIGNYNNLTLTCDNGHELILINGEKIKKHFRHKKSGDVGGFPMSEWHCLWQSYFPDTEVYFPKISEQQIKDRRADIFIKDKNYVIEIQHSEIDDSNVICRNNDYGLHNIKLIWIIDGNTSDVILEELSTNDFLITFNSDWKFKSFRHTYDFILLDIQNKIFKIPSKMVCNKMILVKEFKPIDLVIEHLLREPENIWNLWEDNNEVKPTLTLHQKGAGNGKTFGIWESIALNIDKELYIIVTKQHTAKEVIKAELDSQAKRNEFHIVDNIPLFQHKQHNKQLIVEYIHKKSERKCCVIIGTIDSLIYNLTDNNTTNIEFFEGLLETINANNGCNKVNQDNGMFKYAGRSLKLNKKTELWIDEVQDLNLMYFNAIYKLILTTKIDVVVVGDKLQSLEYEKNFMTEIENMNKNGNINVFMNLPTNFNRRIKVKYMADKINNLVNFNKYNLPNISINDNIELYDRGEENIIQIINEPDVYNNKSETNVNTAQNYVDQIISYVDNEVKLYHYSPEDFLFIFPIMKGNIVATELETKLNEYWIEKLCEDENIYKQYVVLHKHEEGQVIDTQMSVNSSRIMSIRSSKGDGRKVVFILGCNEKALKIISNHEIGLIYESHFHVALTRSMHKIYFGLKHNNDDIHKRFGSNGIAEYIPKINLRFNITTIKQYIDKNNIISLLKKNGISDIEKTNTNTENNCSTTVDWEYHCIRRTIYCQYALYKILNKNKNNHDFKKSEIKTVLDKISRLPIVGRTPNEFYKYLNNLDELHDIDYLPLCNLSHKPQYNLYFNKIRKYILKIQNDYKKNYLSLGEQTPLESVLQNYIIDIFKNKKYHEITPTTIYNILNHFENGNENKISELLTESINIKDITEKVMDDIFNNDENIKWNIERPIFFDGNIDNMYIYNRFKIIGNSENNIYHLVFKTDYNQLNHWDTVIEILLERFLIYNPKGNDREINNKSRFENKKIKTYLFILKEKNYKIFDWDFENNISNELKYEFKLALKKYLSYFNKEIFNYYNFIAKKGEWKEKFKTPLLFFADKFDDIPYIRNLFNELNQECSDGKKNEVTELTKDETRLFEKLDNRIEQMCDTFFGLNIINDDDSEW
jgi:hypothetical protein